MTLLEMLKDERSKLRHTHSRLDESYGIVKELMPQIIEAKEYGKSGRVYWCFYCEEGPLCWDCLEEHKSDYHNIG